MPIATEEEARADLANHLDPIAAFVDAAYEQFQRDGRLLAPFLESRTKASGYRDLIVRHGRAYCDGDAKNGAHYHRRGQLVVIGLENRYIVRVKRLWKAFRVAVSPTAASAEYDGNVLPAYAASLFPDMPDPTLLYLAWDIPENAPMQVNKYLVCNDAARATLWHIPMGGSIPVGGLQQPLPEIGGGTGEAVSRVRVKGGLERTANG